jgi:hypothetical protein
MTPVDPRPKNKERTNTMKTALIKTIISSLLFACGLVSLAAVAMSSGTARADGVLPSCGVHTLRGSYLFATHGWNIVGGVAVPKAIVEGIDFNGDGTLVVQFATVSVNGNIIHASGLPGSYAVEADCTGTATFPEGVSYDIFVKHNGKQLWMIETVGRGGVPVVFEGMATRVSR